MQVAEACEASGDCIYYNPKHRDMAMRQLNAMPGVTAAAQALRYHSADELLVDVSHHHEALYLLTTFCLMPPGDTPSRRGFWDALLMGCIPVRCRVCLCSAVQAARLSARAVAGTLMALPFPC